MKYVDEEFAAPGRRGRDVFCWVLNEEDFFLIRTKMKMKKKNCEIDLLILFLLN